MMTNVFLLFYVKKLFLQTFGNIVLSSNSAASALPDSWGYNLGLFQLEFLIVHKLSKVVAQQVTNKCQIVLQQ